MSDQQSTGESRPLEVPIGAVVRIQKIGGDYYAEPEAVPRDDVVAIAAPIVAAELPRHRGRAARPGPRRRSAGRTARARRPARRRGVRVTPPAAPQRAVDLGHAPVFSPGPGGPKGANVWACACGRTAIEKDGHVWGEAAREQCDRPEAGR